MRILHQSANQSHLFTRFTCSFLSELDLLIFQSTNYRFYRRQCHLEGKDFELLVLHIVFLVFPYLLSSWSFAQKLRRKFDLVTVFCLCFYTLRGLYDFYSKLSQKHMRTDYQGKLVFLAWLSSEFAYYIQFQQILKSNLVFFRRGWYSS